MSDYFLGTFIRNKRESLGMSLRDFGRMCDISHTTIDCIEKGYDPRTEKEINITNNTFSKLSNALGVPISKLVELSQGIDSEKDNEGADGLSEEAVKIGKAFDAAAPEMKKLVEAALSGAQSVRPDTVKIKITCPIDHTEQVIYQPVYRIGGKVIPESNNNGCEMCHQCEECKLCRLRATASILGDFDAK